MSTLTRWETRNYGKRRRVRQQCSTDEQAEEIGNITTVAAYKIYKTADAVAARIQARTDARVKFIPRRKKK